MVPYNVQDEDLSVRLKRCLGGSSFDRSLTPLSGAYRPKLSSHRRKRSAVYHQGGLSYIMPSVIASVSCRAVYMVQSTLQALYGS